MKILVTGAVGRIGRVTVQQLISHNHDVIAVDRMAVDALDAYTLKDIEGARYAQVDIANYESLCPHFAGMDAVIHLAAYAHPSLAPGNAIFSNNAGGAFNVYQAAANTGIKRVVSASSINALGFNFGVKPSTIQYLPMDEEHPVVTTDAYSFSKIILEEIADYFWRREGIAGVCLRFPYVRIAEQKFPQSTRWSEMREVFKARNEAYKTRTRSDLATLAAIPETERNRIILKLIADFDAERGKRIQEIPWQERDHHGPQMHDLNDLPLGATLIQQRTNFWTILDGIDAAQALEKGVTADYEGSHPLYVNATQNTLGYPSAQLAAIAFPEVTAYKRSLEGTEALVSIDKARALIGFEPEYMPV